MRRILWLLPLFAVAGCGTTYSNHPDEPYAEPPQGVTVRAEPPAVPHVVVDAPRRSAMPSRGLTSAPPQSFHSTPPPALASVQPASESASPTTAPPPPLGITHGYRREAPPVEIETPRERPGLATSWGESRVSPVHEVAFRRGSDAPFTTGSIFYNDHSGIDAMASYDVRMAARVDAPVPIAGGITFSVVDESGLPLEAFSLGGRIYVVGENGRRYSIVITNLTDRRYEAVVSVDGLDVLDGKTASVKKRGYLVAPYASITVDGFRKSHAEVAAFRFGTVANSYAARTGSDRNVGVIGFAFFMERGATPWSEDEVERRRSADAFAADRFANPPEGE